MSVTKTENSSMGKRIVSNLTAMGIFGVLNTSFVVAYVSLIFSNSCPEYFATAVALFLIGGCVVSICLASFSSYSGTLSMIQDVPVAISGLIAISLAGMLAGSDPQTLFANIFAAIALSTMLTGISFVLLGHFKLGNLVRFIPYPVMGGFLAATGWLLFKGGLQVSTDVVFDVLHLGAFFSQVNSGQLLCAGVFGVGLLLLNRFYPASMLVMPGTILGSIILFLITAKLFGFSIAELQANGWLLGPLPDQPLWKSAEFPDFGLIDWGLVLTHAGSIATIVVLSVISLLLNSTGVELIAGRDLDMNRDLKVTGLTNMAVSFLGAPASYIFVSQTALATRIGAKERSVGILHGFFLLTVFFVGGSFLSFFPKFIAGGLPLYLGLSMLWEWLVDVRKSMPKVDYAIILIIVLIVESLGFLQGIGIGIVVSVAIFVLRYSSIDIIKHVFDGTKLRSNKDRSITDQRILDYTGEQSLILQLQGFIFFGTANSLYEKVKAMVATDGKKVQFVVMDLNLVQGIDSSAVKSFDKLLLHLEKKGIALILVGLSSRVSGLFEVNAFTDENHSSLNTLRSLDDALEKCEDQVILEEKQRIQQSQIDGKSSGNGLFQAVYNDMMAALDVQVLFETVVKKTEQYLEKLTVNEGDFLYTQGDENSDLFFINRGQVALLKKESDGQKSRIRTLGPWSITGELGSFLGYHSSYDAVVVKEGVIYKLSAAERVKLELEDPLLTTDLHKLVIQMLGGQLLKTTRIADA
jgi:SulP family sulfate permease